MRNSDIGDLGGGVGVLELEIVLGSLEDDTLKLAAV